MQIDDGDHGAVLQPGKVVLHETEFLPLYCDLVVVVQ